MRLSTVLEDTSLILEMRVALFGNPLKITSELLSLLHVSSIGDQRRATDNDFIAKYAHSSVLQGTNQTYIHTHPLMNSKSCALIQNMGIKRNTLQSQKNSWVKKAGNLFIKKMHRHKNTKT